MPENNPTPADLAALKERLEIRAKGDDAWLDAAGQSGQWITGGTEIHRQHAADLRLAARCVAEKAEILFRQEKPTYLICPECGKRGFRRDQVWEPFAKGYKCKCMKCGKWSMVSDWLNATPAVEAEAGK